MKFQSHLYYDPNNANELGASILLARRYTRQQLPKKEKPRWVQWLKIRDEWMTKQKQLVGEHDLTCSICGRSGLKPFLTPYCSKKDLATIDHILPVSKHPDLWNVSTNFQVACYSCNQKKGNT